MGERLVGRRGRGEWVRLVARYEGSGLGLGAFCGREGVAASTLRYWRRRLREEAVEGAARPAPPRFVAVTLREGPAPVGVEGDACDGERPAAGLRVVLASGLGIEALGASA
jgi:hypothetical protein